MRELYGFTACRRPKHFCSRGPTALRRGVSPNKRKAMPPEFDDFNSWTTTERESLLPFLVGAGWRVRLRASLLRSLRVASQSVYAGGLDDDD